MWCDAMRLKVLLQKANNCAYNPYSNPTLHIKSAFNFISLKSIITRHGTNVKWGIGKWFTLVHTCGRLTAYTKSDQYMYIMHWFRKTDTKRAHIQKSMQNSRHYICHHCLCQWTASSALKMDGSIHHICWQWTINHVSTTNCSSNII